MVTYFAVTWVRQQFILAHLFGLILFLIVTYFAVTWVPQQYILIHLFNDVIWNY